MTNLNQSENLLHIKLNFFFDCILSEKERSNDAVRFWDPSYGNFWIIVDNLYNNMHIYDHHICILYLLIKPDNWKLTSFVKCASLKKSASESKDSTISIASQYFKRRGMVIASNACRIRCTFVHGITNFCDAFIGDVVGMWRNDWRMLAKFYSEVFGNPLLRLFKTLAVVKISFANLKCCFRWRFLF